MIDTLRLESSNLVPKLALYSSCHNDIIQFRHPAESLSNYRWIDQVPDVLQELSWIEEMLIALAHFVDDII